MNKKVLILFFIVFCSFFSCEEVEKIDTTSPSVVITYPFNLSIVSEILNVTCAATDNDSLKKIILWIDGEETDIVDSIAPYVLPWNTIPYTDSSSHSITVTAHDMSGNIAISTPIQVIVDNRESYPDPVNILSIDYNESEMVIKINQSTDSDFKAYMFLYSEIENGVKYLLSDTNFVQEDTIFYLTEFSPHVPRWYWIKVIDIYDFSTIGNGYYILDSEPSPVKLYPISYDSNSFKINWSLSENSDFNSYLIFESEHSNMKDSVLIYNSIDSSDTLFIYTNIEINKYKYYQVMEEDYWGLNSLSNIKIGNSWTRFMEFYGDQNYDYGRSILQTEDGNYIILGYNSALGNSANNISLKKVDSQGELIWEHDINFSQTDKAYDILNTMDGGYVIVGQRTSITNGSSDILILKTNSFGIMDWEYEYGTEQDDIGKTVYQTLDGGFIISGQTISPNTGYNYVYLLKVNSDGIEEWDKSYGGDGHDNGYSVLQDSDGGYIIAGVTRSHGDSNGDGFLMKTDSDGNQLWYKTYGGDLTEIIYDINFTNDGGLVLTGQTNSFGSGANDAYLIKVNYLGELEWSQTFGAEGTDYGMAGSQTLDGGYFISGYTDSFGDSGFDAWWIKMDQDGNYERDRTYGGSEDDRIFSGIQTLDGGYAMIGYTKSNSQNIPDILLIKMDNQGRVFD